jgi:hypothetical protein
MDRSFKESLSKTFSVEDISGNYEWIDDERVKVKLEPGFAEQIKVGPKLEDREKRQKKRGEEEESAIGCGYIIFSEIVTKNGNFRNTLILREGFKSLPEQRTALNHFDAYDDEGRVKPEFQDLIYLRDDPSIPEPARSVVRRILEITGEKDTENAELLIKNLESHVRILEELAEQPKHSDAERSFERLGRYLRATRKVLRANEQAIHPHDKFRVAIAQLAREHWWPPTRKELADQTIISASRCIQLCEDNGF